MSGGETETEDERDKRYKRHTHTHTHTHAYVQRCGVSAVPQTTLKGRDGVLLVVVLVQRRLASIDVCVVQEELRVHVTADLCVRRG